MSDAKTNDSDYTDSGSQRKSGLWDWVGAVCLVALTIVILLKISQIPVTGVAIEFRFTDLLALILAIFAIGLSVAFYMRATKDSNIFYVNTYTFTKDMSQALGRIEAVFGERLAHLDKSYEDIRKAVVHERDVDESDSDPAVETPEPTSQDDETDDSPDQEQDELARQVAERDALIERLTQRAAANEGERDALRTQLESQIRRIEELTSERNQSEADERRRHRERADLSRAIMSYLRQSVIPRAGVEFVAEAPSEMVRERLREVLREEPGGLLEDMQSIGWVGSNGAFTARGLSTIRRAAQNMAGGGGRPELPA